MGPLALILLLLCGAMTMPAAAGAEVVLGPGEPLTREAVADLVHRDLVARGLDDGAMVEVLVPDAPLPNRAATPLRVVLADLQYEPDTGRFRARLEASLGSGESSSLPTSGRVQELVDVTVPARPIARGETIRTEDLTWMRIALASLRADTLRRPQDVVGQEAVRPLPAGRPARAVDVTQPAWVRRGEPTAMRFVRGGLEIEGAGIALDQGRRGEPVRVQNAASGEIRRAIVVGPRQVEVEASVQAR